jgi:signal transduction histidine kinase
LGDGVYIYVSDEGVGIPEEEHELIFERFYRAEGAPSPRTQGVGLGLYLCKAIVEAHRGRIWVESEKGKGAKFVFSLPCSR